MSEQVYPRLAREYWTTDLPTEPGWYWISVHWPNHDRWQFIVYLNDKQTYTAPTEWDEEHREHVSELGPDARFLGPIPEPEPPV